MPRGATLHVGAAKAFVRREIAMLAEAALEVVGTGDALARRGLAIRLVDVALARRNPAIMTGVAVDGGRLTGHR